jgi:Xaa-Pro aminopeptidase
LALFNCLKPEFVLEKFSPITLAKSLKNPAELNGLRQCHLRDAAALVQFLAWLEEKLLAGEKLTEVQAAERLDKFRRCTSFFYLLFSHNFFCFYLSVNKRTL